VHCPAVESVGKKAELLTRGQQATSLPAVDRNGEAAAQQEEASGRRRVGMLDLAGRLYDE
jgi:hypothetical protein